MTYRYPSFLVDGPREWPRTVSVDTETLLIRPGLQNPPIVCVTQAERGRPTGLWGSPEYRRHINEILPDDALIVMHNAPFDSWGFRVWAPGARERILKALDEGRLICTIAMQRCIEIATPMTKGPLVLDQLAGRYGIESQDKADSPRKEFGPLLGWPAEDYPEAHAGYAKQDPEVTLRLFERQIERWGDWFDWRKVVPFLTYRNYCIQRYRNYGQITDPEVIVYLEDRAQKNLDRLRELAQEPMPLNEYERSVVDGLLADLNAATGNEKLTRKIQKQIDEFRLVRLDNTQNKKRLQAKVRLAYDGRPPMTKPAKGRKSSKPFIPQIQTGHDVLTDADDEFLNDFASYGQWAKVINADVKMLKDGVHFPVHTKYGTADSLRLTSSDPNLTNLTVDSGIRDGFRPRDGYAFVEFDHSALEFVCTAQIVASVFKDFHMADQVNNGIDSHILVVQDMKGLPYDECLARYRAPETKKEYWKYRQTGKVYNYGCLGFMESPESIQRYARKYGVREPRPYWVEGLAAWKRAQPGAQLYLQKYVRRLPRTKEGFYITKIWGIDLQRYGVTLPAAANTGFQGLGAGVEALCMFEFEQCLNDPKNALYGSHIVSQVHDSFVFEVPIRNVTKAYWEAHRVMTTAPKLFLPDVKIGAEGCVTMKVTKDAELKIQDDGEILIWVEKGKWLRGSDGKVLDASGREC
jgi:hypothetical protein